MMLRKEDIEWIPFDNQPQQIKEADIVRLSNGTYMFVGGLSIDYSGSAYFTEDGAAIDEYGWYITHYAKIIDWSSLCESK